MCGGFFILGGEKMYLPSDDWRVKRALGPYAEPMDEDELKAYQKHIKMQRKKYLF